MLDNRRGCFLPAFHIQNESFIQSNISLCNLSSVVCGIFLVLNEDICGLCNISGLCMQYAFMEAEPPPSNAQGWGVGGMRGLGGWGVYGGGAGGWVVGWPGGRLAA